MTGRGREGMGPGREGTGPDARGRASGPHRAPPPPPPPALWQTWRPRSSQRHRQKMTASLCREGGSKASEYGRLRPLADQATVAMTFPRTAGTFCQNCMFVGGKGVGLHSLGLS